MDKEKFLTRQVFFWVMGVLITLALSGGTYLIGRMDKLSETFNHNFTTVKEDVASIKVDINWIKEAIKK